MTTAAPDPGNDKAPNSFLPQFSSMLPAGFLPSTYTLSMVTSLATQYRNFLLDEGVPSLLASYEAQKLIHTTLQTLANYGKFDAPDR